MCCQSRSRLHGFPLEEHLPDLHQAADRRNERTHGGREGEISATNKNLLEEVNKGQFRAGSLQYESRPGMTYGPLI